MNLALRFRLLVFGQVLLGITAFCIAERNPLLLLIAGGLASASWALTEGPNGRALPRWIVNAGSLLAMTTMSLEFVTRQGNLIVAMGHFTMALQLLMLYARKSNREYSMLLVLSLIQMIGASVLSVSVMYGLLLVAYCALALVTVLMFQLKSTGDAVNQRNRAATPPGRAPRVVLPVYGRGLRGQLRWTWLATGVIAALVGTAVFVVLPRNSEMRRVTTGSEAAAGAKQTRFTPVVDLASGAPSQGSTEAVLTMAVEQFGENAGQESRSFLLRGASLDHYDTQNHTWRRSEHLALRDQTVRLPGYDVMLAVLPQSYAALDAKITMRDTRHRVLFTPTEVRLAGGAIGSVGSDHLKQVVFNPLDRQLSVNEPAVSAIVYSVRVAGTVEGDLDAEYRRRLPQSSRRGRTPYLPGRVWPSIPELPGVSESPWNFVRRDSPPDAEAGTDDRPLAPTRHWPVQEERVRELALSILEPQGLTRDFTADHTPEDGRVVSALSEYLRREFVYSTENPRPGPEADPVMAFLFDHQSGHCELFAAGLTALCRSLNIPARVVSGYRASEYNELGGYYIVRESHAHAWTEINGGPGIGWRTYDATPPELVDSEHSLSGPNWWNAVRQAFEYVEFTWVKSVIAYDQRTREQLMSSLNQQMSDWVTPEQGRLGDMLSWLRDWPQRFRTHPGRWVGLGLAVLLAGGLALLWLRRASTLRRQAEALRLGSPPRPEALRLARRLHFYSRMQKMLNRHGLTRPAWQAPADFAAGLKESRPDLSRSVLALTELFYELRFGGRELDPGRQKLARTHLRRLQACLADPAEPSSDRG